MRKFTLYATVFAVAMGISSHGIMAIAQDEPGKYDVFGAHLEFTDAQNALYRHLAGQAYGMLEKRAREVEAISTRQGWEERRDYVRKALMDCIGSFPERTPLNARVTGRIQKDGYHVENVIFESLPGFYVTASLYVPDQPGNGNIRNGRPGKGGQVGSNKAGRNDSSKAPKGHGMPAILYCSGHSENGRLNSTYVRQMQNFALKGFVVLAFDPIGQGERRQYPGPDGITSTKAPTIEHSYPGTQLLACGQAANKYMIWDGIRAIDYLVSRPEVDPSRIGVTGRSGGGTQTAMISALDDRVAACSPENYLTTYTRLIQTRGPQDAEQNFYQFISKGLDLADLVIAFAPRPMLMITTTNDIFNIQGAKEIEAEINRVYKAMGVPESFTRVEDYATHQYTKKNNESNYAFFSRVFNHPCDTTLQEVDPIPEEDLYSTPKGSVYTSFSGDNLSSLNRKDAEKLMAKIDLQVDKERDYFDTVPAKAKELAGYIEPVAAKPVHMGCVREDGYVVDKYVTKGEGNYYFPYIIFRPGSPSGKFAVYLNEAGKSDPDAIKDDIMPMVAKGVSVLVPDLPGHGEMGPGDLYGDAYMDGVSHNLLYLANLVGRSLLAVKTADLVSLVKMLGITEKPESITGVANGSMAAVMLHAAAFCKEISEIVLTGDICSYYSMVSSQEYDTRAAMDIVPGALTSYDLPELAGSLSPRPLYIVAKAEDENAGAPQVTIPAAEIEVVHKAYGKKGSETLFKICDSIGKYF